MSLSVDLSFTNACIAVGLYFLINFIVSKFKEWSNAKKLRRWNSTSKDLILHGTPRSIPIPNASPFVMKVETYLRAAKIPYELDTTDPFSIKGKTPWISYKDQHVADSHFIIEFLKKKFDTIPDPYTKAEKAVARSFRILLETHFLWPFADYRWVKAYSGINKVIPFNMFQKFIFGFVISRGIKTGAWYHGIGRHTDEEMYGLADNDLRSVSEFLGNKKFILGDKICEEDFGIFGMLSNVVWGAPGSPFERLVNSELPNIKQYCIRMKELYWPDWNECLHV